MSLLAPMGLLWARYLYVRSTRTGLAQGSFALILLHCEVILRLRNPLQGLAAPGIDNEVCHCS